MCVRQTGSCKNVMEDCRSFTDYNPNCALNESIKQKHNIKNSTEYRLYLQRHACQIMGDMKKKGADDNATGCKCNYNHPPHDMEHDRLYSRQVSPTEAYEKNKDFNKPLCAYGKGEWTNYC